METTDKVNPKSVTADTPTIDEVLEKLQAIQRPSKHAPKGGDLAAWRGELERSARNWEAIGRRFMLRAAKLKEQIRAIEVLMSSNDRKGAASREGGYTSRPPVASAQDADPDNPPDLRHTRVLAARFGGSSATGWNQLVHVAHKEAMAKLGTVEALRTATKSNLIAGRPSSEEVKRGYRYVPEIDVSIQNVDAAHAWQNTLRLARHLKLHVSVDFEWMQKSDAAFPGARSLLAWKA